VTLTFLEYHFFDKQGNAIKDKLRTPSEIGSFFSLGAIYFVSSFILLYTTIFYFLRKNKGFPLQSELGICCYQTAVG
jgi:hypothetical protein